MKLAILYENVAINEVFGLTKTRPAKTLLHKKIINLLNMKGYKDSKKRQILRQIKDIDDQPALAQILMSIQRGYV